MNYISTFLIATLCFIVGLTAPFITPVALMFTARDAKSLPTFFSWLDTPDEPELINMNEASVKALFDKYGWWVSSFIWFGIRNRAHGFDSLFSSEAPSQWPFLEGYGERGDKFYFRKHFPMKWFAIHVSFGWQIYASKKYASGLEYRPQAAVKSRRLNDS